MKVSKRFLEIIYYYKNPKNECFGWPRTYPRCGLQHPFEIRNKSGHLIYLSMRRKELKHLKITKAKVREEMDQFWKHTEGEIEEMFPNWNMEIRECEFLFYDVWFEQHRLRLDSEASRMVVYMKN